MGDKFARILVSGRHVLCSGFRAATLTVICLLQAWAQQVPLPADTTTVQALLERVEKLGARVQVLEAEKASASQGRSSVKGHLRRPPSLPSKATCRSISERRSFKSGGLPTSVTQPATPNNRTGPPARLVP